MKRQEKSMQNIINFQEKLGNLIEPTLTAKGLAECIVIAALESEYGKSFTLNRGFARMVSVLADSIVANPELRRQALAVASTYFKQNRDQHTTNIGKRSSKNLTAG
jgi:hypothetical protein